MVPFLVAALVLALLGGATVVVSESPIRAAGGLVTCCVGVSAAAAALSAPLMPGIVLWLGAGGIGLLLLAAVLLLNLSQEERGRRRVGVRGTLAGGVALAFAIVLLRAARSATALPSGITGSDVSAALGQSVAPALGVAVVALASAVVVTIALIRRRT